MFIMDGLFQLANILDFSEVHKLQSLHNALLECIKNAYNRIVIIGRKFLTGKLVIVTLLCFSFILNFSLVVFNAPLIILPR